MPDIVLLIAARFSNRFLHSQPRLKLRPRNRTLHLEAETDAPLDRGVFPVPGAHQSAVAGEMTEGGRGVVYRRWKGGGAWVCGERFLC